jgi:hypothetical protein
MLSLMLSNPVGTMGVPRTRIRSYGSQTGYITHIPSGASTPKTVSPLHYDRCDDTRLNQGGMFPLDIVHKGYKRVGTVSGQAPAFPVYSFSSYPMDNQGISDSHLSVPALPTTVAAMTKVMALTNPSRPEVSVPNFIFELKDIPELLHQKGVNHAKKRSSNSAVSYNFGWELLFRDLFRLIDFTSQVDKRVKELKSLYASGGLSRRRTIYNETVTSTTPTTFQSFNAGVLGSMTKTTRVKVWASVKWRPPNPDMPSAEDLLATARRTVHGWDFSSSGLASIIWEATPWSWFGDYFLNLGDYLNATRNSIGAVAGSGCVMTHAYTDEIGTISSTSPGFGASSPHYVYETKSRVLGTAGITATLPFLSGRQMVTLSSIAFNLGR